MTHLLYSDGTNYHKKNKNMSTEKLQEEFSAFKAQVEELRQKLQKVGEEFITQRLKEMFAKYPKLEKISWSQYTPYFNDGETCEFSSNHDYAEIEGEGYSYQSEEHNEIEEEFSKFMSQFDDELLKNLFGDHVRIVVDREGITIEEHDHE